MMIEIWEKYRTAICVLTTVCGIGVIICAWLSHIQGNQTWTTPFNVTTGWLLVIMWVWISR